MIELSKAHILSDSPTSMNISSYAQETMCYIGQHLVFKEAEEVINSLTGAEVNAKQVERICHHYGYSLEQEQLYNIEVKGYQEVLPEESRKCHYVSVDESMYYTREDGWKETKLLSAKDRKVWFRLKLIYCGKFSIRSFVIILILYVL